MNRISQATADERRRILDDFLDSIFADVSPHSGAGAQFQAMMRSVNADLPDDPTDEQVDAWIELADLVRDETFRARLRAMSERSFGGSPSSVMPQDHEAATDHARRVSEKVAAAIDAGIRPEDEAARPVVDDLVGMSAAAVGRVDDDGYRRELLDQLRLAYEPRAERYWQLLATINGWAPIPSTMHHWGWYVDALALRTS